MTNDADLRALDELCDELWGDPDDEPRPDEAVVGTQVVKIMVARRMSFRAACQALLRDTQEVARLEAQLTEARARVQR